MFADTIRWILYLLTEREHPAGRSRQRGRADRMLRRPADPERPGGAASAAEGGAVGGAAPAAW